MRLLFTCLFICLMLQGISQDVQYLDEYGYVLKRREKTNAKTYHEITQNEEDAYVVSRFTMDNKLLNITHYRESSFHIKHGKYARWDEQGNKIVEGEFVNGEKEGLWVTFWPNTETVRRTSYFHHGKRHGIMTEMDTLGKMKNQSIYRNGKQHGKHITKDNRGKTIVDANYSDGKLQGLFKSFYPNGQVVRKEYYHEGVLMRKQCFTPEGKDTTYFPHIIHPIFPGCDEAYIATAEKAACSNRKLLDFLYKNIQYPEKAKDYEIEGTAIIGFTVDATGNIKEIEPVVSISGDIEAECIRLIKMLPKFEPGIVDGQVADVHYYLPLKFKLE